jgi:peptidoglycan/LPS O-acetylase OafA/YrhL
MKNSRALAYYGYALSGALMLAVMLVLLGAGVAGLEAEAVEELAMPLVFFGLVPAALSGAVALAATLAGGRRERPLTRAALLLVLAGAVYVAAFVLGYSSTAQWTGLVSFAVLMAYCVYALHIFIRWRRLGSIPSVSRA